MTDMLGHRCLECAVGEYQETSVMDDITGTIHCIECGASIRRMLEGRELVISLLNANEKLFTEYWGMWK